MEETGFYWLTSWATGNIEAPLFYLLAFLAIPLAYGVLFDPRIIRCGFLLIGVFGAISGIFLLLEAQFLALAQLMIYAVGITLVVVIALMLTNPRLEADVAPAVKEHKLPAILVSLVFFGVVYLALRSETWQRPNVPVVPPTDTVYRIGLDLLGYYSLPFEFASVLLLIALIGAVMLAKADVPDRLPALQEEFEDADERSEEHVVKV